MILFIKYLLANYAFIFLCWALGWAFFKLFSISKQNDYADLFLKLTVGVIIITVGNAIITTKFNTILLGVPILFIVAFFINKKQNHSSIEIANMSYLPFIELTLITFVLFLIHFFATFKGSHYPAFESLDIVFYSKLSDYIGTTGIENMYIDYLYQSPLQPYHYSELWMVSSINKITNIPTLIARQLVYNTMNMAIIWSGIMAISTQKYKSSISLKLYVFLLVFLRPFYFDFFNNVNFLEGSYLFAKSFFLYSKIFFIELFVILAILFEIKKEKLLAITSLLVIPLVYTTTLPSVYLAFFIYCVFQFLFNKTMPFKEILISFISSSFILFFYYVLHNYQSNDNKPIDVAELFNLKNTHTMINIYGGTIIAYFVLYFPFIVAMVYFLYRKRIQSINKVLTYLKSHPLILFFFTVPIAGLFFWSLDLGNGDGIQLFYNVSVPFLNTTSIFLALYFLLYAPKIGRRIFFCILFSYISFDIYTFIAKDRIHYDTHFLDIVKGFSKSNKNSNVVTYKMAADLYSNIYSKNTNVYNLGAYMSFIQKNCQIISLDVRDIPITTDSNYIEAEKKLINSATFSKYIAQKQSKKIFKTNQQYQLDFIKENRIRFLITLKSITLPPHLENMVKEKTIDPISGEVFCLLKP